MESNKKFRMEMLSVQRISRIPCLALDSSRDRIDKIKAFAKARGYWAHVIVADSPGCMPLLVGAAAFEACLEDKQETIPALIVQTEGMADNLMLALQTAELDTSPNALSVSAAVVHLIDEYGMSRRDIAESLGKSSSWISRMETLGRNINTDVQTMVTDKLISSRTAQEIARLPDDVQLSFATAVHNAFLNKDKIAYLINRYLNENTSTEERERIIHTPDRVLPDTLKKHRRTGIDHSDSAKLSNAMAKCMDSAVYLTRLIDRIDPDEVIVLDSDISSLFQGVTALLHKLQCFAPGQNEEVFS